MSYWKPDKEELIQIAVKHGVAPEIAEAALGALDKDSVLQLVEGLNASPNDPFVLDGFAEFLLDRVKDDARKAMVILPILIRLDGEYGPSLVIDTIGRLNTPEALSFVRSQLLEESRRTVREGAVSAILEYQYRGDARQALIDEAELVRIEAAKQLEKSEDDTGLLAALQNECVSVRCIASWYMGRRQVREAVEPSIQLLQTELDTETLRGVIWSLGVLRDKRALAPIQKLSDSENPVIVAAAKEALSRLGE
jgi:hypothetical protein